MKVGMKIAAVAGGALVVLILVGSSTYFSVTKLIDSNRVVAKTDTLLRQVASLQTLITDAETGVRGYVLTGDTPYLEPYNQELTKVHQALEDLHKVVGDDPVQKESFQNLEDAISSTMRLQKETMEARRDVGFDAAVTLVQTDRSKKFMDRIRGNVAKIVTEELRLLDDRQAEALDTAHNTLLTIVFGTVLAITFVTLFGIFVTQDITAILRKLVRATDQISNGKFEPLSSIKNEDELGELADALNDMGRSLHGMLEKLDAERDARQHTESILDDTRHQLAKLSYESDELMTLTGEQSQSLEIGSNTIGELALDVSNLSAKVRKLLENGRLQSQLTLQFFTDFESQSYSLKEFIIELEGVSAKIAKAANRVGSLADKMTELDSLVVAINDIAAQMNLIALTAAMETSRSGQENTAISPLLVELRTLSDRTKADALKIRQSILELQTTGVKVVEVNDDSARLVRHMVEAAKQAIHKNPEMIEVLRRSKELTGEAGDEIEGAFTSLTKLQYSLERFGLAIAQQQQLSQASKSRSVEVNAVKNVLANLLEPNGKVH